MLKNPYYPDKIYEMDIQQLSWNYPQFPHACLSWGAIVIDIGGVYCLWLSIIWLHQIIITVTLTWVKGQNHTKSVHRVRSSNEKVTLIICTNVTIKTNFLTSCVAET